MDGDDKPKGGDTMPDTDSMIINTYGVGAYLLDLTKPLDCARCGKHNDEDLGAIYVEVPGYKKAGVCVACVAEVLGANLVPAEGASDAEVAQPATP